MLSSLLGMGPCPRLPLDPYELAFRVSPDANSLPTKSRSTSDTSSEGRNDPGKIVGAVASGMQAQSQQFRSPAASAMLVHLATLVLALYGDEAIRGP